MDEFVEIVSETLFGVAPREVGVALGEARTGEGLDHFGMSEGFTEEERIGKAALNARD